MARPIRTERVGGWYHLTARGNERRALYRVQRDRQHLAGDEREQRGVRRLWEQRPELVSVIWCVEEVKGQKWDAFRDRHADAGRDLVLYLGRKVRGLKLNDLAAFAGVKEYVTVAMAVKRFETRLNKQRVLQEECRRVKQMLNVKM